MPHVHGLEDLYIIAMKMPAGLFVDIDQLILNFTQKVKNLKQPKQFWKRIEGIMLPNFKTYYKAVIIKSVWYWRRGRHRDQWDRRETKNRSI